MPAKSVRLQVVVPARHAASFRKVVKREGLTVSAALYRHVLEVVKRDLYRPGLALEWHTISLTKRPR